MQLLESGFAAGCVPSPLLRKGIFQDKRPPPFLPPGVKGDQVCGFLGGRTPFIVRAAEEDYFRLVSECYLHGMLDAEAMDQSERKSAPFETIPIF